MTRRSWPLIALGTGGFVLSYGLPSAVVIANDYPGKSEYLLAPVIGPWILWGHWISKGEFAYGIFDPLLVTAATAIYSGAQAGSILAFIVGIKERPWRWERRPTSVSISPTLGPTHAGVAAFGRF
jgi:hypothetical protein